MGDEGTIKYPEEVDKKEKQGSSANASHNNECGDGDRTLGEVAGKGSFFPQGCEENSRRTRRGLSSHSKPGLQGTRRRLIKDIYRGEGKVTNEFLEPRKKNQNIRRPSDRRSNDGRRNCNAGAVVKGEGTPQKMKGMPRTSASRSPKRKRRKGPEPNQGFKGRKTGTGCFGKPAKGIAKKVHPVNWHA